MVSARQRVLLVLVSSFAAAAAAGPAAAHSRATPLALDFRVRLSPATKALQGVRAEVLDGDRVLQLSVDPSVRLVVRGILGEPVLRFARDGVWVNRLSPTAASDKVIPKSSTGRWAKVAGGRTFAWHDHRLNPPPELPANAQAPLRIPITLDGRPAALTGTFVRVARPSSWPWIAGALVVVGALALLARAVPRRRAFASLAVAGVAASGALAASVGFASADAITRRTDAWGATAYSAALALAVGGAFLLRDGSLRAWAGLLGGLFATAFGLRSVTVFWHGVVLSALSPTATRFVTAAAIVGGAAAAGLAAISEEAWREGRRSAVRR